MRKMISRFAIAISLVAGCLVIYRGFIWNCQSVGRLDIDENLSAFSQSDDPDTLVLSAIDRVKENASGGSEIKSEGVTASFICDMPDCQLERLNLTLYEDMASCWIWQIFNWIDEIYIYHVIDFRIDLTQDQVKVTSYNIGVATKYPSWHEIDVHFDGVVSASLEFIREAYPETSRVELFIGLDADYWYVKADLIAPEQDVKSIQLQVDYTDGDVRAPSS